MNPIGLIVFENLNAQIGKVADSNNVMGLFPLSSQNKRSARLIDFPRRTTTVGSSTTLEDYTHGAAQAT